MANDDPLLDSVDGALRVADAAERFIDETLGLAALTPGGDVAALAQQLADEVGATPQELVTAHVLRLERYLRDRGAWSDPDAIDPNAFAAVPLEQQADLLCRLWPIAAACGWRPAPVVAQ